MTGPLADAPSEYLRESGTALLRIWLEAAHRTATLLELDQERRRRGIARTHERRRRPAGAQEGNTQ